nr:hypothetical protein BpHYR1_023803 [Ipomoea batatas]
MPSKMNVSALDTNPNNPVLCQFVIQASLDGCDSIGTPCKIRNRGKAIEARLQNTVSVGLVHSIISVHKLEDLIVPRFCWLVFLLQVLKH